MSETDAQDVETIVETPARVEVEKAPAEEKVETKVEPRGAVPGNPPKAPSVADSIKAAISKVNEETAAKTNAPPAGETEAQKAERARAPDGKFAKEPAKKADTKPLEGAKPGAEQPKADAAPGTWRTEAKAEWAKLPAHVKAEVSRRESDFSREVGKYQQQIQQINQAYTPLEQVIGPKRAMWRAQFGNEAQALSQLVNISDLASQDPNGFLAFYLGQPDVASRVDLQKVFGNQAPADDITRHPVVAKMQQTINGLQHQVSGFASQQQNFATQSTAQQIAQFIEERDAQGNPARPHFEAVRKEVHGMLPALAAQYPDEPVTKIMDRAYNIAIRTNHEVAVEIQKAEEQRIRDDIAKQERARKAQLAAKSVPAGAPPPSNGRAGANASSDLRAELMKNFREYAQGTTQRV